MKTVLLTQSEVAELLRVSITTVRRLRLSGELPFIPDRPVRFREADVEAYMERKTQWHDPARPHTLSKPPMGTGISTTTMENEASAKVWRQKIMRKLNSL